MTATAQMVQQSQQTHAAQLQLPTDLDPACLLDVSIASDLQPQDRSRDLEVNPLNTAVLDIDQSVAEM
jgi:hypothetical protein